MFPKAPEPVYAFDVDQRSLTYKTRWNNLRSVGNSWAARASIAVPLLGYLLLFHNKIVEFLQMHAAVCPGCEIPWRLQAFYFGSFSFAVGSVLYGWFCPTLIKKYGGATEFFEAEKNYFANPQNFEYLDRLIAHDREAHSYDPKLLATLGHRQISTAHDLTALGGKMGEYYVLQNMSYLWARVSVGGCYILGGFLLAIPTVITFFQVLQQVIRRYVSG